MSTDGDLRYKPKGQRGAKVRVKGKLSAEEWADFEQEYKQLARGYGLTVVGQTSKKKAAKKKSVKKKVATKKKAK